MRALLAALALVVAFTALPLAALIPAAAAQEATEETALVTGSEVIVVLEDGDDPEAAARQMGVEVSHVYRHVFTGFAGTVLPPSEREITAARARRRAKDISPDGEVSIAAQIIPTGVSRAGTPKNPDDQHLDLDIPTPVDADIAVIDTGIADNIADLDVQGGHNCVGGNPNAWQDDNGHGTHVAGISAAIDNNEGVVGVAPGARLWAVKVLNAKGEGSFSDVICGLDWVAGQGQIDVINLSLSGQDKTGSCAGPALHVAVCGVVAAGVTVVVAAGNQETNASNRVPAAYSEVVTVSAITDSDGRPGGLGPRPCFGGHDDVFANFTNFGSAVDIAAPGGCILSYSDSGQLVELSGTSQASPHVAGAAADFIASGDPSPNQVRNWLLTTASRPQSVDGVTGDPDSTAAKKKSKRKKVKKLRKKLKKAKKHKSKKKRRRAKKKLRRAKRRDVQPGHLEPVLWLQVLG